MISPASPDAHAISALFGVVFWMALAVFLFVEGLLVFIVVRYRAKGGEVPREVHGHIALELTWTIVPALILAALTVLTLQTMSALGQGHREELAVRAVGQTWSWEFQYPGGVTGARVMRIPVGKMVRVEVISRDVIHSFWAPELGGKTDAIPGAVNTAWLQAERPGTYKGQCVEFCGFGHSLMLLEVVALEPEEFEAWLKGEQARLGASSAVERGAQARSP